MYRGDQILPKYIIKYKRNRQILKNGISKISSKSDGNEKSEQSDSNNNSIAQTHSKISDPLLVPIHTLSAYSTSITPKPGYTLTTSKPGDGIATFNPGVTGITSKSESTGITATSKTAYKIPKFNPGSLKNQSLPAPLNLVLLPSRPKSGLIPSRPKLGLIPSRQQSSLIPSRPKSGLIPSRPQSGLLPSHSQSELIPSLPVKAKSLKRKRYATPIEAPIYGTSYTEYNPYTYRPYMEF